MDESGWIGAAERWRATCRVTPAVAVDVAAANANVGEVARYIAMCGGEWRAHVKTVRTAWGVRMLLSHGVRAVKASTIGEAYAAASAGCSDVLLAYPALEPKLAALGRLAERFPAVRFSALIDTHEAISAWPATSGVAAMIDLDTGMRRTGIEVADTGAVIDLARGLAESGVELAGLHSYDGHLAAVPVGQRLAEVRAATHLVNQCATALTDAGARVPEIVAGATHTLEEHLAVLGEPGEDGASEARRTFGPGTLALLDGRSRQRLSDDGSVLKVVPAAMVFARVVSRNGSRVTLDAGATAIQADAGKPHARVLGASAAATVRGLSQEHLVIEEPSVAWRVGDVVPVLPWHIDTALSQFREIVLLGDGEVGLSEPVVGRH
ncbi:alanine racemase [Leucobacter albus]|uniref:Alanine racemase n=1 Tax=Leucobacter albus TaxID=272210 RepID=A0ABW3TKA8_9MICO